MQKNKVGSQWPTDTVDTGDCGQGNLTNRLAKEDGQLRPLTDL